MISGDGVLINLNIARESQGSKADSAKTDLLSFMALKPEGLPEQLRWTLVLMQIILSSCNPERGVGQYCGLDFLFGHHFFTNCD